MLKLVESDESDTVHRCRNCDTMRRLTRGSAAGLDLDIPDPTEDGDVPEVEI